MYWKQILTSPKFVSFGTNQQLSSIIEMNRDGSPKLDW